MTPLARHVLVAAALATLTACASQPSTELGSPITESDVQTMLDEQREAWDRGDFDAFMQGYLRSPELSFVGGSGLTRGYDQTLANYRSRYPEAEDRGVLRFDLEMVRALPEVEGRAAVAVGRWHLTRESPIHGWFSLVLVRRPEGLRIVHDHSSVSDEPVADDGVPSDG